MSIDVTKLKSSVPAQEKGMEVKLREDDGSENGAVIIVAGPDTKRVKDARASLIKDRGDQRIRTVTGDRMDYESRYIAAASCISWSGLTDGDKAFECNVANAMKIFEVRPDWQEQVEAVANNRSVFTKA